MEKQFFKIVTQIPSVCVCRCSPTDKAYIVKALRKYTKKRICAVGDGGNDVSMILEASCGIGIVGKEGNQASLAAEGSVIMLGAIILFYDVFTNIATITFSALIIVQLLDINSCFHRHSWASVGMTVLTVLTYILFISFNK